MRALGALVLVLAPVAAPAAGCRFTLADQSHWESRRGFYLGHTLSGTRQPVLLNLREGSERDRNTAILSVGALGFLGDLIIRLIGRRFLRWSRGL